MTALRVPRVAHRDLKRRGSPQLVDDDLENGLVAQIVASVRPGIPTLSGVSPFLESIMAGRFETGHVDRFRDRARESSSAQWRGAAHDDHQDARRTPSAAD